MKLFKSLLTKFFLAGILLSLSACLFDSNPTLEDTQGSKLFVVTSDYKSGVLRSYSLDGLKKGGDSLEIAQDSRVLNFGGFIYVLERYQANNILKYDPINKKVIYQVHLGVSPNPSDIINWKNDIGFITLEDSAAILQFDTKNGTVMKSLDISKYSHVGDSGTASSPNARNMAIKGDTLFVALQRRNKDYLQAGGLSTVLIINMNTFTIIDTLVAPGKNADKLWLVNNTLFMSCPNAYGSKDVGAIYQWDLGSRKVTTTITETSVGGNLNSVDCDSKGRCVATIDFEPGNTQVRRFNLLTGAADADFLPGITDAFGGAIVNPSNGSIYVGERNPKGAGVILFNDKGEKVLGPVTTGLPPYSLSIFN